MAPHQKVTRLGWRQGLAPPLVARRPRHRPPQPWRGTPAPDPGPSRWQRMPTHGTGPAPKPAARSTTRHRPPGPSRWRGVTTRHRPRAQAGGKGLHTAPDPRPSPPRGRHTAPDPLPKPVARSPRQPRAKPVARSARHRTPCPSPVARSPHDFGPGPTCVASPSGPASRDSTRPRPLRGARLVSIAPEDLGHVLGGTEVVPLGGRQEPAF